MFEKSKFLLCSFFLLSVEFRISTSNPVSNRNQRSTESVLSNIVSYATKGQNNNSFDFQNIFSNGTNNLRNIIENLRNHFTNARQLKNQSVNEHYKSSEITTEFDGLSFDDLSQEDINVVTVTRNSLNRKYLQRDDQNQEDEMLLMEPEMPQLFFQPEYYPKNNTNIIGNLKDKNITQDKIIMKDRSLFNNDKNSGNHNLVNRIPGFSWITNNIKKMKIKLNEMANNDNINGKLITLEQYNKSDNNSIMVEEFNNKKLKNMITRKDIADDKNDENVDESNIQIIDEKRMMINEGFGIYVLEIFGTIAGLTWGAFSQLQNLFKTSISS